MADLPTQENSNFRFILIDAYSEISGTPDGRSGGRSTHPENSNFRFILIDTYSESSGRPSSRSYLPSRIQQFQIYTDRCIL